MSAAVQTPDTVFVNAAIHTQNRNSPLAEALAVASGRITAVGCTADMHRLAGTSTQVVNLEGRTVIPGMTDSHIHFYEWAMNLCNLDLATASSLADLLKRVRNAADRTPSGRWILGLGWNEAEWPEKRMPSRDELDAAAPDQPVALWRCDMHLAALNSAALTKAGVEHGTPDPAGGEFGRDSTGRLSGILRESAINRLRDAIPEPSEDDILTALRQGIRKAHSLGLTGLHDVRLMNDADGARALRALQRLRAEGQLDLRCWVTLPGNRLEEAVALGLRTGFGDERLRIGHVKFFADGGMGARTAWMIEPYRDAGSGLPQMQSDDLFDRVIRAEEAGLAVMVHAVGDRANREVIGVFEKLQQHRKRSAGMKAYPCIPHRIEHVQMIHPDDLKRLRGLELAACVTPQNMVLDINVINASVGARGRWAYAFRDLMDTGVPVMFSSDAPVCEPDPLAGIQAAVTRSRKDGTPAGGWYPESKVSVAQAVAAYTVIPAAVHGLGREVGTLEPGQRADFVALNRDIYAIDPLEIVDTRVDLTVFEGRIVYQRDA